jgi:hypothetical protein
MCFDGLSRKLGLIIYIILKLMKKIREIPHRVLLCSLAPDQTNKQTNKSIREI